MGKTLVAYFSASGVTRRAAERLAEVVDGELYEIRPAVPYTPADLNWMDKHSRSSVEMRNPASRPALADHSVDVGAYDRVFLGFPIWWGVAPTIVNTFLEGQDWTGKTIVLFATSGGSGMGKTAEKLAPSCPGAKLIDGGLLNGSLAEDRLTQWAGRF